MCESDGNPELLFHGAKAFSLQMVWYDTTFGVLVSNCSSQYFQSLLARHGKWNAPVQLVEVHIYSRMVAAIYPLVHI